jgi:hypothetical protein
MCAAGGVTTIAMVVDGTGAETPDEGPCWNIREPTDVVCWIQRVDPQRAASVGERVNGEPKAQDKQTHYSDDEQRGWERVQTASANCEDGVQRCV